MFCYRKVETAKASPTLPRSECQRLVLCWVDSYLWSSWAPDFRPWECVQDSEPISIWSAETTWYGQSGAEPISQACCLEHIPMAKNLKWGLIRGYWQPNSEVFWAYHYIFTLGWTFFMENHFPVATCQQFFPKFKVMTSVYFIGKNRWQVATGKSFCPTLPWPPTNNFSKNLKSWQVFTSHPGCHGKEKTRSRQEWKCNGQPGKSTVKVRNFKQFDILPLLCHENDLRELETCKS